MTEVGVFVVWSRAAWLLPRVLECLGERFEIHRVVEIVWTPDRVGENFHRFYRGQTTPPYGGVFESQKGGGPFTLITILDHEPEYAERDTNRGKAVVNTRWFDTKLKLRSWVDGRMEIHGADSSSEARRDLLLLLGMTTETFLRCEPGPWDERVERVSRDLTGSDGWGGFGELFEALNCSVRYVVLRNFEALPADHRVGARSGVDILTDDLRESIRVLNARPELGQVSNRGGRFFVDVGGERVRFALWPVESGDLDARWAESVLDDRLMQKGMYVPAPIDYFETLAYHAVYHKRKWQDEYRRRLSLMASDLGIRGWEFDGLDLDRARAGVNALMQRHGYEVTVPRDTSAFFNYRMAGASRPVAQQKLRGIRRVGFNVLLQVTTPVVRALRSWRGWLIQKLPWIRQYAGRKH